MARDRDRRGYPRVYSKDRAKAGHIPGLWLRVGTGLRLGELYGQDYGQS